MEQEKTKAEWRKMSEEVISGLSEWREKNAKATFREIEDEVDKRLSGLRAQMITGTVMQSASAGWMGTEARCPQCGTKLQKKGKKKRRLQTQEGQTIELEREYGVCPKCGHGLFPPR